MKRLLLAMSVLSILAFTSCKKTANAVSDAADATAEVAGNAAETVGETTGDMADATTDAMGNVADSAKNLFGDDFSMPEFESEEAKTWANNLVSATESAKQAATSGDVEGLQAATTKFNEVAAMAKDFAGTPDVAKVSEMVSKATQVIKGL